MKKSVCGLLLVLLLGNMVSVAFGVQEGGADNQPNGDSLSIVTGPSVLGGSTQTSGMIQNPNTTRHKITSVELESLKERFGVGKQEANYNQLIDGHGTGLRAPTEQQWIEIADNVFVVESVSSSSAIQSPSSIDQSTQPWFPPIGDQDGEGSCVAWAVGYCVKTFQEAKEHGWNLSGAKWEGGYTGHPTPDYQDRIISPDFIYHLINFGVDGGAYFYDAIQLVCFVGASSWEKMPYDPVGHTSWPSEEAWREAPLFRGGSNGYQYMWVDTDAGLVNLKNWLVSGQLAIIGVDANKYASLTSSDLWTLNNYVNPIVNHANTVVGYDDNIAYTENGQTRHGAFKIANSWGVGGWENINDGYYWISYEAMKQRISYCMIYDDIIGYKPELAATFRVVHNARAECGITVGVGNPDSPIVTKRFSDYIFGGNQPFCSNDVLLDITEFKYALPNVYNQSYFLQVYDGGSSTTGAIYKFAIEYAQNLTYVQTVNDNFVALNVVLTPLQTPWANGKLVNQDQDFTDGKISSATDNDGNLYVTYADKYAPTNYAALFVDVSADVGQTWSHLAVGLDSSHDLHNPSIAIDPSNNNIYVALEREWTSSDHDIFVLRCVDGIWSWVTVANSVGSDDRFPSITCEYQYGYGNWQYISYEYVYNYDDRDLMFAKSVNQGLTWSISKLHGGWPDSNVHAQSCITNAEGYLYIAYKWGADYGSACEIRVDVSADFGSSWTQYTDVDGMPNGCSYPTVTATRGGSMVMVAYQYNWSANDIDVWYSFSNTSGSTWTKGNPLFTSGLENEKLPVLVADGEGTQHADVKGYLHVVCKVGRHVQYRIAHYSEPTYWSSPETIAEEWIGNGLAISTFPSENVYHPYVSWTDTRTKHIYSSARNARTWIVDDDGPADFNSIQAAISTVHPGDIAYVREGVYYENVVVNKTLSLVGEDVHQTIIDGNYSEMANSVEIAAPSVDFNGFTVRHATWAGIYVGPTTRNHVSDNILTNNEYGLYLNEANTNSILNNSITDNRNGLVLTFSTANVLRSNMLESNTEGILVYGSNLSDYLNDIDISNQIDGKPVYYWVSETNKTIPADAGYVALVNCTDITVRDLNFSNKYAGILLAYTNNTAITNNTLASNTMGVLFYSSSNNSVAENQIGNNQFGLYLNSSPNNTVVQNNITYNGYGFYLSSSSYNRVFRNNLNNAQQVLTYESANFWDNDYPQGGNYWMDYVDVDVFSGRYQNVTGSDVIWDHPYSIDANNTDHYPLAVPWEQNLEWNIVLTASHESYSDLSNLGVRIGSTEGFDTGHDAIDAPAPPTGVVSYFWYPNNPTTPVDLRKLSTSIAPPSDNLTWTYSIRPVGIGGTLTINWTSESIALIPPEYSVLLLDTEGKAVADMRKVTEYSFAAEPDTTYNFTIRVLVAQDCILHLYAGWNMVSFPVLPTDTSFPSIFNGTGYYQVLTWSGTSYLTPTDVEAGRGYWVLVLSETTVNVTGAPVESYALDLPAGWSMIGSIFNNTVNAGTVFPGYYQLLTWDGGKYVDSTTIESGKGYWTLVLEPTHIVVE